MEISLLDLLKKNKDFSSMEESEQELFARLAEEFEDTDLALYCTPEELSRKFSIGEPSQWRKFLNFEAVKTYISKMMAENMQVAARKAMHLQGIKAASDLKAANDVIKAAGILNQQDNRIIIMHQINRPRIEYRKVSPDAEKQPVQAIVAKP